MKRVMPMRRGYLALKGHLALIRAVMAGLVLALAAVPAFAAPKANQWGAGLPDAYALYARGDYVAAAQILFPKAAAGDAKAQGLLGFLYEHGQGVPQDYAAAAFYYSCAAEQGEATAQYLLGLLHDKGRGVPLDVVLAQKWLILAAARADRPQQEVYARIRDAVATKMTKLQIRLAQQAAGQWVPTPPLPPR